MTPGGSSTPGGAPQKQLTPSQLMDLAQAKTLAGSEAPVAPDAGAPRKRSAIGLVVVGAVAVAVIAGVGVLAVTRTPPPAPASSSPPIAATSAAVHGGGGAAVMPSVTAAPDPKEVEITVTSVPEKAHVFQGTTKLGEAPGPFKLPYGREKVTLTIRLRGYQPKDVDVVPSANLTIPVTLGKEGAAAPGPGGPGHPQVKPRDFDNPF
jgi:hypothetical protein